MKVRARVLENRVDLDLERHGNILTQGRDEVHVMNNKRENEQKLMREELQKQIDEKNRIKEEVKAARKKEEMLDEIRVREQMHQMAIAEGKIPDEDEAANLLEPVKQLSAQV